MMTNDTLTKKQKEAVESASQATMVIAGPGTGKTHILASRIEYLVKHMDIPAESILALTFSKSGANSMRERVIKFLGKDGYKVTINTFHGFASSLFDENPQIFEFGANLKEAANIDTGKIIEKIINELTESSELTALYSPYDKYFYFKDIVRAISHIKKEGIGFEEFREKVEDWQKELDTMPDEEKLSSRGVTKGQIKKVFLDEQKRIDKNIELALIYKKYQEALQRRHLFDYEDMIIRAIKGLKTSEDLRYDLHLKYKAILVDEYQDTSGGQNKLLFLLIPQNPNVFIVGDDDQAIFRFQGATIENFREFLKKFPDAKIISLEDNFRSPQLLLNAALSLAKTNTKRITAELGLPDKKLIAHGEYKDSKDIIIHEFETDIAEHTFLVEKIKELKKNGSDWDKISVITRTNKEQSEVSEILRSNGIPTYISSQQNALDEPNVSSLFAIASACINPHDNDNLLEFLLHPATPIERVDVWKILENYKKTDKSLYVVFTKLIEDNTSATEPNPPEQIFYNREAAQKTYDILNELSGSHTTKSGAHWLKEVLNKTGLLNWILSRDDYPYILANVRALTDEARRIQAGNPAFRIKDIIEHFRSHRRLNIPLKPSLDAAAFENAIQIMTAHKIKGLEYENVFIIHAAEGNWSNSRGGRSFKLPKSIPVPDEGPEDERKLFYVALTRAKKQVFVTYAKSYTRGIDGLQEEPRETQPSLFIEELKEHIEHKAIQKEVEDFIIKTLKEPETHGALEKEIVKNIISDATYALNPTSLNSFLDCPKKFLYEKLFRVPTIQTFTLTYGNAVHWALQKYFLSPAEKRNFQDFISYLHTYIKNESTLTESENKQMIKRAEENLKNYWENTLRLETQPLEVEYRFKRGNVEWKGVRIAGNIDKISPAFSPKNLSKEESKIDVTLTDYKTSEKHKTQNAILGKTKDKKAPNMHRQLMFYKLLTENAEGFRYTAKYFALDFVEPNMQIDVPIEKEAYEDFKNTLENVWNSIQKLTFIEGDNNFPFCGECKYCKLS